MPRIAAVPTVIYSLSDPRTSDTRYIGKTYIGLAGRLANHIAAAKRGKRTHSASWIRGLLRAGQQPIISCIEIVPAGDDWAARESYWISVYRVLGGLTNHTDGGEGWCGHRHSAESRAKISARHKGRAVSAETRAKLSASRMGAKLSPEHKAKLSRAFTGRAVSLETRRRMSVAQSNRPVEFINRGAKNGRAVISPETASAIKASRLSYSTLRLMYGISKSQVARIKTGEHWKILACG